MRNFLCNGEDLLDDALGVGELLVLDMRGVDGRGIDGADAFDRGVEVVKGVVLNEGRDLSRNAAERFGLIDKDRTVGFFDAVDDGVLVERADGAEVDDLGVDVVLRLEFFRGFESVEHTATVGDEGNVGALAFDVGFSERNGEVAVGRIGHVAFDPVEKSVLHEVDRIVVANRGFHEAFGVSGGGRRADLEPGEGGKKAFGSVRMSRADIGAAVGGSSHHDGAVDQAARHVAHAGRVVDQLVKGNGVKGPKHEFHHGADPQHGSTDAHADEAGLGDWGVDDAFVAPLVPEPLGDLVGAVVLSDFLAHEDDVFVASELFVKGFAEGVAVFDFAHGV